MYEKPRLNFAINGDVACQGVYVGRIDTDGDWQPEDGSGWDGEQVAADLRLQMDDQWIDFDWQPEHHILSAANRDDCGDLHDYQTGEYLRPATAEEREESLAAGDTGAIFSDSLGVSCYVIE